MRRPQTARSERVRPLSALTIILATTAFLALVAAPPVDAKPKKKKVPKCRIEGKVVSCRWLELCLLGGGLPHKVYGKVICYHPPRKRRPRR